MGFAEPSAFETFIQYAGLFLQLLYFVAIIVLAATAVWATIIFKRFVDRTTGGGSSGEGERTVSVEQFVE